MAYTGIDDSSAFFQCTLYTGNGSNRSITNTGHSDLQPDLTWLKARSESEYNFLYDVVRGATKGVSSDLTAAEATYNDGLTAFGSDGFSLGTSNGINRNGTTYVSWNWKAGTSVSGNTGGSGTAKTYTGSVNTDAGFSIIRYIGNGSAGHTIPHHLGTTPAWVIARTISAEKEWDVYHHKNTSSPETDYLVLNTTAATSDSNDKWNDTAPTSSVVTLGDSSQLNTNDGTCIMYAFAEKQGYSKFGSYTGNGNADGPFVYTGFKPAFIMYKNTARAISWLIHDNKRLGYNPDNDEQHPDTSAADGTDDRADILSNGFKIRESSNLMNVSGEQVIYMAFAESPSVTSGGVPTTGR